MNPEKKLKDVKSLIKGGRESVFVFTSEYNITVTQWVDKVIVHTVWSSTIG